MGTLAAGVAYDFNNLLAIIMAHNEMLSSTMPKEKQDINSIIDASQKAGQMTQQLLVFAHARHHNGNKI